TAQLLLSEHDTARDHHNGNGGGGESTHRVDDLSVEGLFVEPSLPGEDQVGPGEYFLGAQDLGDHACPGKNLGPQDRGQGGGHATGGTHTGAITDILSGHLGQDIGKTHQPGVEYPHLFGAGTFL